MARHFAKTSLVRRERCGSYIGGGPSDEERRAQREAEERARQQQAQATQFIQAANVPDPLEERLRARDISWLDWEEQKNGPLDVSKAPLGPALGLYDRAVNRRAGDRYGIGALQMGLNASNPELSQVLSEQSREHRQQEAAGDLESAVRMKSAEVNQSALPLAEFAQDRRMGLASLASGNAANSTNAYLQFLTRPRRRSFWQDLLLSGAQNAGAMTAAAGSDSRAKDNIQPIKSALDKLLNIHGYTFEWNAEGQWLGQPEGKLDMGVLAQEVEVEFPELVTENQFGYKMVNYNGLLAVLLEALRELKA